MKHSRRHWHSLVLLLTMLISFLGSGSHSTAAPSLPEARVIEVNDGDTITIMMNGKRYRTRLIGIDAPELRQELWGKKARQHLRKMFKESRWQVLVETDVEQFDKYNRLLVYLWTGDQTLVNEQMLLDGYAVLFTFPPNTMYRDRLRKAQRAARENNLGIWGPEGLKEPPRDYKKKHPRE